MHTQSNQAYKGNLVSLLNLETGKMYEIIGEYAVIGRSLKNDICLLADSSISQKNSEIFRYEGDFYLRDLNSKSGTAINGKPIWTETLLQHGDILRIGVNNFRFQIHYEPSLNDNEEGTNYRTRNGGLLDWFYSLWYNMTRVEPRRMRLGR